MKADPLQTKAGSLMTSFPLLTQAWYPVCRSSRLQRRPLARTVLETPLVFFRSAAGQAAALLDRCPHRNVPLSSGWVAGEQLVCPYHGWQFDARGACVCVPGMVETRPQKAREVQAYPVCEQDGLVWVYPSTGMPASQPPRLEYLHEPGYTHFLAELEIEAALPDALENFLDGTHTHFVHAGLIRSEGPRKLVHVTVRRGVDRVEAEYRDEGPQTGLIWRLFGGGVDGTFGRYLFPSTAQLEYRAGAQLKMLITLIFTPETETRQRLFAVVSGQGPAILKPLVQGLFWGAFLQDRRILKLQAGHLRKFDRPRYVYTEMDLLIPDILRFLKHGPVPGDETVRTLRLLL
jgi:phenylpropionate dioxygenase-like ring-hydroxylating dioxygenase large terminal subunit